MYITWKQPQVLSAYFKHIDKACTQLANWNVKVNNDDILIHVVDQMYESDWFSEDTMTKWEETQNHNNIWSKCHNTVGGQSVIYVHETHFFTFSTDKLQFLSKFTFFEFEVCL